MINRVKIEIQGSKVVIATPESEEYVLSLGEEIDSQVSELMKSDDRLSLHECLMLCCINYLDNYRKSEKNVDRMRGQITEYLEDAAKARIELDEIKRENEKLRRQLEMGGNSEE